MNSISQVFDPKIFSRGDSSPLYLILQKAVREAVSSGRLAAESALPAERDLAEMLGVSRVTVRKAIATLVSEGVLVQKRGSGTYVAHPRSRLEQPLSRLTSFTEDMATRGLTVESQFLDRTVALPNSEEAMVLGLPIGEEVCRIHRLRRANGMPLALELAVVPRRYLPDPALIERSLYAAFQARGVRPVRALQRLHALALDKESAALLEVPEGSPALYIQRISYLADGSVVEFTRSYYRGDAYDFVAELTLTAPPQEQNR